MRTCPDCGAHYQGNDPIEALSWYADHSTQHNPSPGQWANAYMMMRDAKERAKPRRGAEPED